MKKEKRSGIYEVVNLENGKRYIGQASNLKNRKHEHSRSLKGNYHWNSHLQNSYNKYGEENFKFKVLLYCELIPTELTRYEQFFVDSYPREELYNIRTKCVESNLGIKLSKESRKKISENHANVSGKNNPMWSKKHSEEVRRKMSENHADFSGKNNPMYGSDFSGKNNPMYDVRLFGENNGFYGKKHSEQTLKKLSGENGSSAKLKKEQVFKILDLYYNKKYTQVKISESFPVAGETIHLIVRGKTWKSCYKEFMKLNPICTNFYNEKSYSARLTKKQIFEILDLYYNKKESQIDIAKKYNVTRSNIGCICLGKSWKNCYKEFIVPSRKPHPLAGGMN